VSVSQIAVTSSPMMSGPQFTRPQSTGLSGLGALMLETYHKLRQKPKTVPVFKDALQSIWSVLWEKAGDWLPQATAGMWVSQQWIFWTYVYNV